jgi:hypothetical protein
MRAFSAGFSGLWSTEISFAAILPPWSKPLEMRESPMFPHNTVVLPFMLRIILITAVVPENSVSIDESAEEVIINSPFY